MKTDISNEIKTTNQRIDILTEEVENHKALLDRRNNNRWHLATNWAMVLLGIASLLLVVFFTLFIIVYNQYGDTKSINDVVVQLTEYTVKLHEIELMQESENFDVVWDIFT